MHCLIRFRRQHMAQVGTRIATTHTSNSNARTENSNHDLGQPLLWMSQEELHGFVPNFVASFATGSPLHGTRATKRVQFTNIDLDVVTSRKAMTFVHVVSDIIEGDQLDFGTGGTLILGPRETAFTTTS